MATKKNVEKKPVEVATAVSIKPPNMRVIELHLRGTAPLCVHKFSAKALGEIESKQREGSTARSKKVRTAKKFEELYEEAKHVSDEGWLGLHAASFRNGAISACRTVGFAMTRAKLALFVEADGYDATEGSPLVRIYGEPHMEIAPVRNETGVPDLRARPVWNEWEMNLRLKYDADMFTDSDVVNLIQRVGAQVGVGEGRPDSKKSAGIGRGLFEVIVPVGTKKAA